MRTTSVVQDQKLQTSAQTNAEEETGQQYQKQHTIQEQVLSPHSYPWSTWRRIEEQEVWIPLDSVERNLRYADWNGKISGRENRLVTHDSKLAFEECYI